MGRTPQIRITKNDRKEYARLVKNAKAKINRTIKEKGSQVVIETEKGVYSQVDIRSLVEMPSINEFVSRKEFNRIKQQLSNFTNRNNRRAMFRQNEYGVVTTQATINAIEKDTKEAKRLARKKHEERLKLPFVQNRQVVGTQEERMRMGRKNQTGIFEPEDFHFEKMRFPKQLIVKGENVGRKADPQYFEKRAHNAKMQLARTVEETFNGWADDIADKLRNLPDEVFDMMFQAFEEFQFENWNISPLDGHYDEWATQQEQRNLSQINYYLDLYYEGRLEDQFPGALLKEF